MRKVLGKIPGQPNGPSSLERTPGDVEGAKAPNPTSVNASSPMGHSINPNNTSGALSSTWYTGIPDTTDIAIDSH